MNAVAIQIGSSVSFELGKKWYGTGDVVSITADKQRAIVRLDAPCKDNDTGELISVQMTEII